MDPSSSHLPEAFLSALLSLSVNFYNFAVGILATILSSFIRTCNSLGNFIITMTEINISEGSFQLLTDSAGLLSPTVILPATLVAVLFVLTHSREGYDGIANILSTLPAILPHMTSGFALVITTVSAIYLSTRGSTKTTKILVFLTTVCLVFLIHILTVILSANMVEAGKILVEMSKTFEVGKILIEMSKILVEMSKIPVEMSKTIEVGKTLVEMSKTIELKPIIEVLAAYRVLPQILAFLLLKDLLRHYHN